MNLRALLVASAFLPVTAFAQEAEPCAGGGAGGGDVSQEGECDGTDAIFCGSDGNIIRVPCGDIVGDGSVEGGCEVYAGFGSWCAMPDGQRCLFEGQDGLIEFACATDSSACVGGVCTAGNFACTPPAAGAQQNPACLDGSNLSLGCNPWGQPSVLDCPAIDPASTCSGDVCGNIAEGGPCQDGIAECEAGVTCEGASANAAGTCGGEPAAEGEGEAAEGEGEDDNDGGNGRDDEPEPTSGRGCLNAFGAVPVMGPLALALLALRRRRRA